MILRHTRLVVADNTGAKIAMCIGMLGRPLLYASIGRIIKVTIKEMHPLDVFFHGSNHTSASLTDAATTPGANMGSSGTGPKVRPGEVHNALLIRCRQNLQRPDGRILRFDDNAIVLLGKDMKPLGTKVFGPVPMELKKGNWLKVLSLSSRVV